MPAAKILVVEDDPSISTVLEETLKLRHYDVRLANSPEGALAAAAEYSPDLILMDVNLSAEIDGIETAARIREASDVPVCFVTAYSGDETIARAEKAGAVAYLSKPFEVSDVTAMVTMSLANARRMREARRTDGKRDTTAAAARTSAPAQRAVGGEGLEDRVTGLPNRAAAEAMLPEVEGSSGFVTALAVDHVQVLKQRFGTAALERIIISYSQHLAQHLPDGCTLCRWGPTSFVILPPPDVGSEMEREIFRMHSQPMLYHLQLTGRSALLRISSTAALFRSEGPGSLAAQLNQFLGDGLKHTR